MGFGSHRAFVERRRRGPSRAAVLFEADSAAVDARFFALAYSPTLALWAGCGNQLNSGSGPGYIATSPGQGAPWTTRATGVNEDLRAMAWSGQRFVAAGTTINPAVASGVHLTSADGLAWAVAAVPLGGDNLNGLAADGAGRLLSVGNHTAFAGPGSGSTMFSSEDNGLNWLKRADPSGRDVPLYAAVHDGVAWIAVGGASGAGTKILTSPDRIAWTDRTAQAPANQDAVSIAHDGRGRVVAGTIGGVMTSDDRGATWQGIWPLPLTSFVSFGDLVLVSGLEWTGRQWFASARRIVQQGGFVLTSRDGRSWALVRHITDDLRCARRSSQGECIAAGGTLPAGPLNVQRSRALL